MVADELRRQADQFVDIADLEQLICRDPGQQRPQREARSFAPRAPQTPRDTSFHDRDDAIEEV